MSKFKQVGFMHRHVSHIVSNMEWDLEKGHFIAKDRKHVFYVEKKA